MNQSPLELHHPQLRTTIQDWVRVGQAESRGRIQRFRHDLASPLTPLINLSLLAYLAPPERDRRLHEYDALASRILAMVDDFCSDLRQLLESGSCAPEDLGMPAAPREPLPATICLPPEVLTAWLPVNPGDQDGRISAFAREMRQHLTPVRALPHWAACDPVNLVRRLEQAGDSANEAWLLVRHFCEEVKRLLDPAGDVAPGPSATPTLPAVPAAEPSAPPTRRRILAIDDEREILVSLQLIFSGRPDYQLVTARDGAEGLQKFRAGHFDLVLTDHSMPGMNGTEVASAIKQLSPQTPVVLVSAHVGMLPAGGGDPRVFDACLAKPFSREALLAEVNRFLQ
jgi:CheY-like chemotaxis protein